MARRTLASVRNANTAAREAMARAMSTPAANPDHLGDLTWWVAADGWRADVSSVESVFSSHGIPAGTLPPAPDWQIATSRAITSMAAGLKRRDFILENAADGPNGERRIAVLSVARNGRVATDDQGTVVCPKDGTAPYVERHDPAGIASELVSVTGTYFHRYTSDDIRGAVVATLLRYAALMCRPALYWLPAAGSAAATSLRAAVEQIGWGRIELFSGYASDPNSTRACVNAVSDSLESKLQEFSAAAAKFGAADPTRTKAETIEAKLEEAARLRSQWTFYRSILGATVESGDDRIAAIESDLRATLGIVENANAKAA